MYLYLSGKIIIADSKIDRVSPMKIINSNIRVLSTYKIFKRVYNKSKNDILPDCLRYIGETHNNGIISLVNNIDNDLTKTCFYKLGISAKITKDLSTKFMLKITTKLSRVHIDLWKLSPNIFLKRNCYI